MKISRMIMSFRNMCLKTGPIKVKAFEFPLGGANFHEIAIDNRDPFHVASGQFKITHSPNSLDVSGMRACIALTLYDPKAKIGGLTHLAGLHGFKRNICKDIVVPLIREMVNEGAKREYLEYRLLGGSEYSNPLSDSKNFIDCLRTALKNEQIKQAEENLDKTYDWVKFSAKSGMISYQYSAIS